VVPVVVSTCGSLALAVGGLKSQTETENVCIYKRLFTDKSLINKEFEVPH
jgi:hypothetical protein